MHPSTIKALPGPVLPDPDGKVSQLVSQYIKDTVCQDALKARVEQQRDNLISLARPFHNCYNSERHEFSPVIEAVEREGRALSIGFSNSYRAIADEAALLKVLGPDGARFLKRTTSISTSLYDIPQAALGCLVDDLKRVFQRHGVHQPLEIESKIKPSKWFHQARHQLLTPEQNAEIDKIAPCTVTIRRD